MFARVALVIGLCLSAIPYLPGQEAIGGAKVYKDAVSSTVWIHSTRPDGKATGSGTLIDAEKRLVLTNFHVVEDNPKATVFFPESREGKPIPERQYYNDRAKRLGIPARVIVMNKSADLAILQLDSIPEGTKAVAVAEKSPEPGEMVHSIGNAGKSGALWGYVKGTVRQVYRKKWQAALSKTKTVSFEARVIETDSPTNPGDSGGPLLNDKGQLIGVTQGGATNAQLVSFFVDLTEVQGLLKAKEIRELKGAKKTFAKRTTPIAPTDTAKVFDAEKLQALKPKLEELFQVGVEVVIETYPKAPEAWIEKAKKATPEERQKYFRDWADERENALKMDGVLILVCLEPRVIHVEFSETIRKKYPEKFAGKVGSTLITSFRDKKPDDGLAEVLKMLKDNLPKSQP
jgi:V8-like Glu-specific endopeptidase